jgi:polyphosphate kinase
MRLIYLVKDIIDIFIDIKSNIKDKMLFSKRLNFINGKLRKDLLDIKRSILNREERDFISELGGFDKDVLKSIKIYPLLNRLSKIDNSYDNIFFKYEVNSAFENYNRKLYKRLYKLLSNIYSDNDENKIDKRLYRSELIDLQIELVKLQEWARRDKKRIAIIFEGRDAAGKGSSIKRFVEHLNPKFHDVVALGIPTEEEALSENWLVRYEKHLPKEGELTFFDRSWYNRGVVEPTLGYCTPEQYEHFMHSVNDWENKIIDDGVILFKFWFSIDKNIQLERFEDRKLSPLKHWKYTPNDEKTIDKWDIMTNYKQQMFDHTSTNKSPWILINSNDKRLARLNSIRYILSNVDYEYKDTTKKLNFDEKIVTKLG